MRAVRPPSKESWPYSRPTFRSSAWGDSPGVAPKVIHTQESAPMPPVSFFPRQ
jgi:hypothetical protein